MLWKGNWHFLSGCDIRKNQDSWGDTMKRTQHLASLTLFTVCLGIGTASQVPPPAGVSGAGGQIPPPAGGAGTTSHYGGRRCPTATLEGTVSSIDLANQKFDLVMNRQEAIRVVVNEKTRYKIPGYKKKDLKADGLGKLPVEKPVKVRYCADSGDVLEVKVKKLKKKKG